MFNLDNSTTLNLTGLISIGYGLIQLVLFRKRGITVVAWSASQVLLGVGLIGVLYLNKLPLTNQWILAALCILLSALVNLSAISIRAGYPLPKKPTLICLGGVFLVGVLFEFSRGVGAPLGSLEAILLAPLAATYIYTAWFSGSEGKLTGSKYIYVISGIYWIKGLFVSGLTLGALAAVGEQYIIVTSDIVNVISLVYLLSAILNNMTWSIQISEDLILNHTKQRKSVSIESTNSQSINIHEASGNDSKPIKEKKISNRVPSSDIQIVNVDSLSKIEKLSLLDKLTDKEKEVCILVAEGKKNQEIAALLNSSESSVKVHKSRLTAKLGVKRPEDLKKLISNDAEVSLTTSHTDDLTISEPQKSLLT